MTVLARLASRPFALLAVLGICWALASPVFAPPDEPSQVVKAAAVAHGQLVGAGTEGPYTAVHVPEGLIGTDYPCFAYQITSPASCAPPLQGGKRLVVATTYSGRYPPLYYLLVGWPSLFLTGTNAVYAMRVLSALLAALLLASAFRSAAASANRRLLLPALGAVATPYVLYLAGAVNPSGAELAASVCAWSSGLVLSESRGQPSDPGRRRLLIRLGVSLAVLAQLRGLGLLMSGFVLATLIALGGRSLLDELKTALGRGLAVLVGASAALAGIWLVLVGGVELLGGQFVAPGTDNWHVLGQSIVRYGRDLVQMIGMFGWWDGTYMPRGVYIAWFTLPVGAVALAVFTARGRRRALVLATAAVSVAVPVLLVAHQARYSGIVGQGRYWYPLTVGAVLLAAHQARVRREDRVRWTVSLVALTVLVLQVVAFRFALDRYRFGLGGAPDARAWSPPAGAWPVTIVYVVAIIALVTMWWRTATATTSASADGRGGIRIRVAAGAVVGAVATVFTGVPALAVTRSALSVPPAAGCQQQACPVVYDPPSAQVAGLTIDTGRGGHYDLSASGPGPVRLGLGGLSTRGTGRARVGMLLAPVGDQQWYLDAASTDLAGGVYGPNSVTLNIGSRDELDVTANIDVGDMVVAGGGSPDVTHVTLNGADLNGGGENPVALVGATLSGQGHLGPLTTSAAVLEVGTGAGPAAGGPGVLTSTGDMAFDPATTLLFHSIGDAGAPGRGFPQLAAAGNVSLGSAVLKIESSCAPAVGATFPLLEAGALAGAFSRPDGTPIADGDVIRAHRTDPTGCPPPRYRILYGPKAVTAVRI